MVFSSVQFLFLFLPAVFIITFIVPGKFKNYILIVASLLFYVFGEKGFVVIMFLSVFMNYLMARLIDKSRSRNSNIKIILFISVIFNLSLLGVFKYLNFVIRNINLILSFADISLDVPHIHLPIGISFFTFQAMSYVIDVYRKDVVSQKKFSNIMLYISMFPQLVAGPIVRYVDIEKQLETRKVTIDDLEYGIIRFITGLGKKVLIANNMALVADGVFNTGTEHLSSYYAWIGLIAYTLQIYFDFSGYSDMAIGLGRMFGFKFLENFNYPYISSSIKEFWRRWHISLSTWFRDYVYIPLGGNRKGNYRTYLNLFIIFFLTGLWHGAEWTFIIWGLYHGFFLIIERSGFDRIVTKLKVGHVYTIFVVMIGWVFFRSESISYSYSFIKMLFSFDFTKSVSYDAFRYINNEFYIYFCAGIIFSTPVVPFFKNKIYVNIFSGAFARIAAYCSTIMIFLLSAIYLVKGSYNPFIYFRF